MKVNKEKMDLIKVKGLKLQDILDKAMDKELGISEMPPEEERILELTIKIEKIKKERDEALRDCDKKINILMKNLIESRNHEEENYNKQIELLKLEKEYLEKQME